MSQTITAQELRERMNGGDDFLLVDTMPPPSYLLVHLPGAINIPLDYLHEVIHYLPKDRDIVVYCSNEKCRFSEIAAQKLELHDFDRVYRFIDGLAGWERAGYFFETILLPTNVPAGAQEGHQHAESKKA